jgi:hypothetical protein
MDVLETCYFVDEEGLEVHWSLAWRHTQLCWPSLPAAESSTTTSCRQDSRSRSLSHHCTLLNRPSEAPTHTTTTQVC